MIAKWRNCNIRYKTLLRLRGLLDSPFFQIIRHACVRFQFRPIPFEVYISAYRSTIRAGKLGVNALGRPSVHAQHTIAGKGPSLTDICLLQLTPRRDPVIGMTLDTAFRYDYVLNHVTAR